MSRFQIDGRDRRFALNVEDQVELLGPVGRREAGTRGTVKWIGKMFAVVDFGGGRLDSLDAVLLEGLRAVSDDRVAVG